MHTHADVHTYTHIHAHSRTHVHTLHARQVPLLWDAGLLKNEVGKWTCDLNKRWLDEEVGIVFELNKRWLFKR